MEEDLGLGGLNPKAHFHLVTPLEKETWEDTVVIREK